MKNSTKNSLKKHDDNKRLVKTPIIENSKKMSTVVIVLRVLARAFECFKY